MLGIAAGSYACNLIYRLPINEPLFKKNAFCASCNTFLKPKDLFPLFSWLWLKGKCRYCGAEIPGIYALTEAVFAVVFCAGYLTFGHTESFILFLFMSGFSVIMAAIAIRKGYVELRLLWFVLAAGLVWRTYLDNTFFSALGGGYALGLLGIAGWRAAIAIMKTDIAFPPEIFVLFTAGVCLGLYAGLLFIALWALGFAAVAAAGKLQSHRHYTVPLYALLLSVLLLNT